MFYAKIKNIIRKRNSEIDKMTMEVRVGNKGQARRTAAKTNLLRSDNPSILNLYPVLLTHLKKNIWVWLMRVQSGSSWIPLKYVQV